MNLSLRERRERRIPSMRRKCVGFFLRLSLDQRGMKDGLNVVELERTRLFVDLV
jgi:hypothetical protein